MQENRWPEYSPPEGSTRVVPRRNIPPMKSMHENNVVWLCAKYAVDANLFRLESSILTRAKRLTNRNNVGGEYSLGEYTGVERSGDNFPGESYLQHRDLQPENTLPRLLPNGQSCAVYRRILVAISIAEAAQWGCGAEPVNFKDLEVQRWQRTPVYWTVSFFRKLIFINK